MYGLAPRDRLFISAIALTGLAIATLALVGLSAWALALTGVLVATVAVLVLLQVPVQRRSSRHMRRAARHTESAVKDTHATVNETRLQLDRVSREVRELTPQLRVSERTLEAMMNELSAAQRAAEAVEATGQKHIELVLSRLRRIRLISDEQSKMLKQVNTQSSSLSEDTVALAEALAVVRSQVNRVERQTRDFKSEMISEIQAMFQLMDRFEPSAPLPLVAGWALSPAGLFYLADMIERRDASLVVECGSGTSTLWMAFAMRRKGTGKILALEHEPEYAAKTQQLLITHGVADWAEVRLCPLVSRTTPRGEQLWYDFNAQQLKRPIDILLVDGPPRTTGPLARYPALPMLRSKLVRGSMVIADDANRSDERETLALWRSDWPELTPMASPGRGVEVLEVISELAKSPQSTS